MKNLNINRKVREMLLENQERIVYVDEMTEFVFGDSYGWKPKEEVKSVKAALGTRQRDYMYDTYGLILVPVKDEGKRKLIGWKVTKDPHDKHVFRERDCKVKRANSATSSAYRTDNNLVSANMLAPKNAFEHIMFELRPNEVIKQLN